MDFKMFRARATSKYLRSDAPGTLLTVAPPSTLASFAVMASVSVALALIGTFGRAQAVATGRGVVRSDQPPIVIHAPLTGTVSSIVRRARDRVSSGDLIIVLDARAETAAHQECIGEVAAEKRELAALEERLASWNDKTAHDRDASMALVLITQIRTQREKATTAAVRCDALATVLKKSRVVVPVDATVADVAISPGAQVHEGDVLATLTPASAHLVGYAAVAEQYRSEIDQDQQVRVKFDALPFDDMGAGTAHVVRVLEGLPSGVKVDTPEGAGVFLEIALDAMPSGAAPARAGMTFTADVHTRRVRLLTLLLGSPGGS